MVKRTLAVLMGFCLLLGAAACSQQPQAADLDEAALTKAAQQAEQQLREGDYASVYASFDSTMQSAMTEEDLKTSWETAAATAGQYVEQVSANGAESGGY